MSSPDTRLASSEVINPLCSRPSSARTEQSVVLYAAVRVMFGASLVVTGTANLVQLFHIHVHIGSDRRRDVDVDVPETVKFWKITAGSPPKTEGDRFTPCTYFWKQCRYFGKAEG